MNKLAAGLFTSLLPVLSLGAEFTILCNEERYPPGTPIHVLDSTAHKWVGAKIKEYRGDTFCEPVLEPDVSGVIGYELIAEDIPQDPMAWTELSDKQKQNLLGLITGFRGDSIEIRIQSAFFADLNKDGFLEYIYLYQPAETFTTEPMQGGHSQTFGIAIGTSNGTHEIQKEVHEKELWMSDLTLVDYSTSKPALVYLNVAIPETGIFDDKTFEAHQLTSGD